MGTGCRPLEKTRGVAGKHPSVTERKPTGKGGPREIMMFSWKPKNGSGDACSGQYLDKVLYNRVQARSTGLKLLAGRRACERTLPLRPSFSVTVVPRKGELLSKGAETASSVQFPDTLTDLLATKVFF